MAPPPHVDVTIGPILMNGVTDTVMMSPCFITVENHSRNRELITSQLQYKAPITADCRVM